MPSLSPNFTRTRRYEQPPRALRALARDAVVAGDRPTLWPSWEPSPPGTNVVVLAGRATHVP
jgi:hypothetical protein